MASFSSSSSQRFQNQRTKEPMASFSSSSSQSLPSISSNLTQPPNPNTHPNSNPTLNIIPESVPVETPSVSTQEGLGNLSKRKKAGKGPVKRVVRSKTWDCFTRPKLSDGSEDPDVAECNFCKTIVPASTYGNGTSSLWSHGKKCKLSPLYEKPADGKSQTTLNRDNVSGGVSYHKFNQNRCDAACVRMIIMDELPFRHVEGKGFEQFVHELQPQWKKMNRKQVAKGVWELYQSEKAKLMSEFATHQTRVSITTDTWTSIQNINYMVVTAHFLDSDWNLHKRIINFCSITSHKGDDIGRVLEQCLVSWGITNVFTITVDNASANDTAVHYMRRRLRNSTYLMLDAALKYEKVFERMALYDDAFIKYFEKDANGKGRVGPPEKQDWRNAQAFVHFLGKFHEATVKLSAWKKVTAHLLFTEMIGLKTEIVKKIKDPSDPVLQRVAQGMKVKFDKYWGSFEQMNKIIVIANVLDPRWKLQYQKKAFARIGCSAAIVSVITNELKTILVRMYDEYRVPEAASSHNNTSEGDMSMEGVEFDGLDGGQDEILADLMRERMDEQNEMICNEVDKYLSDRYVHPLTQGFDIAQWWKVNAGVYPILSKLAKDIFAIPCSTVASENAFSLGKRVVDPYRSCLTPKMVECLVCSTDWLNATQPNFYKDPTVEEMEIYQELEALEKETAGLTIDNSSASTTSAATSM